MMYNSMAVFLLGSMQKRKSMQRVMKRAMECEMKLKSLECCRACMALVELQPIFDDYTICEQLTIASGLQIIKDDGLPQQICLSCISIMQDAINFRNTCKQSEETLLSLIEKKPTNEEPNKSENQPKLKSKRIKTEFVDTEESDWDNSMDSLNDNDSCNDNEGFNDNVNIHNTSEVLKRLNLKKKPDPIIPGDLKCNICEKVLKNKNNYLRHMVVHTGEFPYMCEQCGKGLMTNAHLISHMKVKHGWKNKLECSYCGLFTVNKSIVQVSSDNGNPQNACLKCIKKLNKTLKFNQKTLETDNEDSMLTEDKPNEIEDNNATVIDDQKQKSLTKPIKLEPNDVQIEVKIEFDSDDIPLSDFITDEDNKISRSKIEFVQDQHDESEVLDGVKGANKIMICQFCLKILAYRSLHAHIAASHAKEVVHRIPCIICERYIMKSKVNRHTLLHGVWNKEEDGAVKCCYCKIEFSSKQVLLEHLSSCTTMNMRKTNFKMHHPIKYVGMKPVCEHCGRTFVSKIRLNEHCRSKHGHEKLKCSYCDFQSCGNLAMRNHERRHRGEKPFVCEKCGAKFHAAYLLTQHKKSHRTEKLIKCPRCPQTFKAKNSLHMHTMRCHSSCIYKCFLCDRTYNCRNYVVKHLRHFHDFKDQVPPLEKVCEDHTHDKVQVQDDATALSC